MSHNLNIENELPNGEDNKGDYEVFENGAAFEQTTVHIEPKKRSVRNPRPRLTVEILCGRRGIQTIEEYFADIRFSGRGCEKHDLGQILRRLQHWGHRMYPIYNFDDLLTNIQRLSKKKSLQVHMSRYRLNMLSNLALDDDGMHGQADNAVEADEDAVNEPFDEFDALLGKQIAISKLAPYTPKTNRRDFDMITTRLSTKENPIPGSTPSFAQENAIPSTPYSMVHNISDSEFAQPLPQSKPYSPAPKFNAEQFERMEKNKRLAQERLYAKKNTAIFKSE